MQNRPMNGARTQIDQSKEYKKLWCAVMVRALADYAKVVHIHKDVRHPEVIASEPHEWLLRSEEITPGSFHWICAHLGWNAETIRELIRTKWRDLIKLLKNTTV